MTESQFNIAVIDKISQIMKAVRDYQNNPVKAAEYIERNIAAIAEAGKKFGSSTVINELFNGK
ncbi:MAG: hypothetical protein ACP5OA_03405 [Candidatus Woesearchaeota archaeon]